LFNKQKQETSKHCKQETTTLKPETTTLEPETTTLKPETLQRCVWADKRLLSTKRDSRNSDPGRHSFP
jgi:hypothetical protein